ncbi:phage tail assembly chaperone [Pseudorhodoferax sp. Leaf274]|uniref:phage tail assembly chaperone n=1 Tax=Pseudorhodoferax sp. Leaf274 TaxID=1736318 RepID=UPI000703AD2A|nr:phage tail assembly chaperone [Pseudorhodoferax sp. Leaf274]KQP43909.1 hypothetical protein ASF44_28695 [Pseudorhodoferax sp. Leaf274]
MLKPFSLDIEPTFTATVKIPVPGKSAHPIEFTFKHRDEDAFKEFGKKLKSYKNDTDAVMDIACGWDLEQPWERENVEKLVKRYLGSAKAIIDKYALVNSGAELGN